MFIITVEDIHIMGLFNLFKKKNFDNIRYVNDENFQTDVIERSFKEPVIVDFWADWCGPCMQLKPTMEKIASDPDAPFTLMLAKVEENQMAGGQLQVSTIPDVRFFRNGKVVGSFKGSQFEHNIRKWIDDVMAKPVPQIQVRLPRKEEARLELGYKEILAGNGFQATVALDSVSLPDASILNPVARFLWDGNDGDLVTTNEKLDTLYYAALEAFDDNDWVTAETHLQQAQSMGTAEQKDRTKAVLDGVQLLQTYMKTKE